MGISCVGFFDPKTIQHILQKLSGEDKLLKTYKEEYKMQQHAQPLVTTNEFGESEIGRRLDYSKPSYKDPVTRYIYTVHYALLYM